MVGTLSLFVILPLCLVFCNWLADRFGSAAAFRLCPPLPMGCFLTIQWWLYGDESLATMSLVSIGSIPSVCAFGLGVYYGALRKLNIWIGLLLGILAGALVDYWSNFALEPHFGTGVEMLVIPAMVLALAFVMRTGQHASTNVDLHARSILLQVATVVVLIAALIACAGRSSLTAVLFFTLLHSTPRLTMELSIGLWHEGGAKAALAGISQLPFALALAVVWCLVAQFAIPLAGGAVAVVAAWLAVAITWSVLFVTRPRVADGPVGVVANA